MTKLKGFFNNGEFNFWKFVIITLISAAFSAGVGITFFNNRIETLAQRRKENKQAITENREDIKEMTDDIQLILRDVGVIKNDVDWIKKNLSK